MALLLHHAGKTQCENLLLTHTLRSVALCRPQAGVVHRGRGHQSAAEPQTRPRRIPAEAPAQLLPNQRELHPPEPTAERQLPPLQRHRHHSFDGQRVGHLLQIGLHLNLTNCPTRTVRWEFVQSCMNLMTFQSSPVCIISSLWRTGQTKAITRTVLNTHGRRLWQRKNCGYLKYTFFLLLANTRLMSWSLRRGSCSTPCWRWSPGEGMPYRNFVWMLCLGRFYFTNGHFLNFLFSRTDTLSSQ